MLKKKCQSQVATAYTDVLNFPTIQKSKDIQFMFDNYIINQLPKRLLIHLICQSIFQVSLF